MRDIAAPSAPTRARRHADRADTALRHARVSSSHCAAIPTRRPAPSRRFDEPLDHRSPPRAAVDRRRCSPLGESPIAHVPMRSPVRTSAARGSGETRRRPGGRRRPEVIRTRSSTRSSRDRACHRHRRRPAGLRPLDRRRRPDRPARVVLEAGGQGMLEVAGGGVSERGAAAPTATRASSTPSTAARVAIRGLASTLRSPTSCPATRSRRRPTSTTASVYVRSLGDRSTPRAAAADGVSLLAG